MKRREFFQAVIGAQAALAAARLRAQAMLEADIVIVGAGSSGCLLANRLSADPSTRVLLVEAGPLALDDPSIAAAGRWVSLIGSRFDWNYSTELESGLAGRSIKWPRGKVVGGSSAINAMAYVRGDRRCFDLWATEAGASWSAQAVEPYFARAERELVIADTSDPHAGHTAFVAAARALGHAPEYYKKTIRNGRRQTAADAYLVPALARKNLAVTPDTFVRRILFTRGRAAALEVLRGGAVEQIRATRAIVLAAGAVASPKLLMLSGIGPAAALEQQGIRVTADAPLVGSNLQDHPRVSLRWKSVDPLAPSATSAGLFVSSGVRGSGPAAATGIPDLQFYVGRGLDAVDEFITLTVALSQPASRGSISLRSADPLADPVIRPNYFAVSSDLEALERGVRVAREIAAHQAYDAVRGDPVDPAPSVQSPGDVRTWIRRAADTIFHPAGTCRIGRAPTAVLDPELRVRGVDGLRVADASVMPTVVNSQTQAACLMIAEKAAALIMAEANSAQRTGAL